jgi:phosphatidate phosphatase APP1
MRHFPGRSFVLIGDSGEHDPEVYAHVRKEFGAQVQEIRIRDVIDDRTNNPSRLEGMTIIPAPTIGSAQHT